MVLFLLTLLLVLLITSTSILYEAWVFSWLWTWFAVPLFGLPELGVLECAGLLLILYFARAKVKFNSTSTPVTFAQISTGLLELALYPALFLGAGWIVKSFMG